jgi:hypothetical protein
VQWNLYPGGIANHAFIEQLNSVARKDQVILFLCRSGVRSRGAATLAANTATSTASTSSKASKATRTARPPQEHQRLVPRRPALDRRLSTVIPATVIPAEAGIHAECPDR